MIASIDIGTSYSSICILGADGRPQPVDISTGASMFGDKYSLPSAVFVEDGGSIVVGQAAMNSRKHKPQNFHMEFKRNLGEDIPILLGERRFRPEELYTELFRHMKARAEKLTGEFIEKAYLTYPASYGQKRRERLCAAANAAGLFELELVDEPTAAAMCYCAEGYVKDGQILLVYDFGGGTFDVSLIQYKDGTFQLLSEPLGLERCGGMDIDYLIAADMRKAIEQELPGAWEGLQRNSGRFLRFASQISELAVKAKHHLSDANCFEEYIEVGMDDVRYQLTAERFNGMIASLVGDTLQICRRALDEAGVSTSEVSAVLMVGGTSRIPLVQEMARKITGAPALCAANLELIVAQGALTYRQYQKEEKTHQEAEEKARREETEKRARQEEAAQAVYDRAMARLDIRQKRDAQEKSPALSAEQCFRDGLQLYQSGQIDMGLALIRRAADLGHGKAAFHLGQHYASKDRAQSVRWYRKAANLGNENAIKQLKAIESQKIDETRKGSSSAGSAEEWYQKGLAAERCEDWAEMAECYRKAADLGHAESMYNMGVCYEDGEGVTQDYNQAAQWYRKAANLGNENAIKQLNKIDETLKAPNSDMEPRLSEKMLRQGMELERRQDLYEAAQCYRRAVDSGSTAAAEKLENVLKKIKAQELARGFAKAEAQKGNKNIISTKQKQQTPERYTLTIERANQWFLWNPAIKVCIDGSLNYAVENGQAINVTLPAGQHHAHMQCTFRRRDADISLTSNARLFIQWNRVTGEIEATVSTQ